MRFVDGLGNELNEGDAIAVPVNNTLAPGKIMKLDMGLGPTQEQAQPSAIVTVVLHVPSALKGLIPGVLAIKTPSDTPDLKI